MVVVNVSPIHNEAVLENVNNICVENATKKIDWENSVNITHLNGDEQSGVIKLLRKYSSVFSQELPELGACPMIQHEIHLTVNIPIKQKPYRVPYKLKDEMRKQINILLDWHY
ncbi:hypothetical protein AVEN_126578-1 [Araneus ventricosus]|uniref:Uncharacterized protein n=1 Tax=Araneus ventricosus TaxID=182803 RepID=A0A4Y2I9X2_ARAVE|nr:hypothetical protein AVEN_126578-1 [Araneus ventricosus]